jgi:RNA polymerase sigma-70 factor (ECF subfamily)
MRFNFDHDQIAAIITRIVDHGEVALLDELLVTVRFDQLVRSWLISLRYDDSAHDICQEVLIQAWRCLPQLRTRTMFVAWLKRIVRSIVRARWKASRSATALVPVAAMPEDANLAAGVHGVAITTLDDQLIASWLEEQIDLVCDENYAKVLHLRVEGYSDLEIAEQLGIPHGTVKTWVHRGRKQLREYLTPLGFELPAERRLAALGSSSRAESAL